MSKGPLVCCRIRLNSQTETARPAVVHSQERRFIHRGGFLRSVLRLLDLAIDLQHRVGGVHVRLPSISRRRCPVLLVLSEAAGSPQKRERLGMTPHETHRPQGAGRGEEEKIKRGTE